MPPLRGLTEAQRKAFAEEQQKKRVCKLVNMASTSAGLNQKQLAEKLGWTESRVSAIFTGRNKTVDLYSLIAIADAVKMPDDVRSALLGSKTKCRYEI